MAPQLDTIANEKGIEEKEQLEELDEETVYRDIAQRDSLDDLFGTSWEHYMDEDRAVSASEKVLDQVEQVQEMQFDPESGMVTLSYHNWERPVYVLGFEGGMILKGDNASEAALISEDRTEQGITEEITGAIRNVVDRHWGITREPDSRVFGMSPDYDLNLSFIEDAVTDGGEIVPEAQQILAGIQDDPYESAAFMADGVGVWHTDEYTMLGEIDEQRDAVDLYAVDETEYALDLHKIHNNLDTDTDKTYEEQVDAIERKYQDLDLGAVAESIYDIAVGSVGDEEGWGLYNVGEDHTVLTRLENEDYDRQTEAMIMGFGEHEITLSDQAKEKAEKAYEGGSKEAGFKSALQQVLEAPDAERLDFENDGLTYKKGDDDTRLYGIESNDGSKICVFETGDHDHMRSVGLYDDTVAAKQVAQQATYRISHTEALDRTDYA